MALSRRVRSTRLLVITLVFASLVTITLDYRGGQSGPLEVAGKAALTVVGPMQQAVARVVHPVGAFFTGLAHIASLESDNRRLRDELRSQRILSAQAEEALRENAELRKLAGISGQLGLVGPRATVVGQSLPYFEWSVTIDKGSSQCVAVDQPVVA